MAREDNEEQHPADREPAAEIEHEDSEIPSPVPVAPPGKPGRRIARTTALVVVVAAAVILGLVLVYYLRHLVLVVFVAMIVAATVLPAAVWLERRRVPRVLAILIPYLVVAGFFVLLGFLIIPPFIQQARSFLDNLPNLVQNAEQMLADVLHRLGLGSGTTSTTISNEIHKLVPSLNTLLQLPLTVVGIIGDILVVLVSSILMLYEREKIARWVGNFVPRSWKENFEELAGLSMHKVGRFILGQLIIMTVIGIGTGLVMFLLGLPFALPMGVLGFVGEIVPYLGPIVAGVPATIIGFVQSPTDGLIMGAWLIVLHILEAYVLGPQIQHRVLRVSPLAVIIIVVAALSLFGIIGALVAVPFIAIMDIVVTNVVFPYTRGRRGGGG